MMYTVDSVKDEVLAANDKLTEKEWKDKIYYRGLEHKFDKQLVAAADALTSKLNSVLDWIQNPYVWMCADGLDVLAEKRDRIKDKLAAIFKEQEFRADKKVDRTPVGTTYYSDYGSGNDANTGLSTGQAWKTIDQFTTTTVRSPGDILKLRANVVWDYGAGGENKQIDFDEDGTFASNIFIIGCNSSDDPWGDASDVHPVVDFNGAAYSMYMAGDSYWNITRLDVREGAHVSQGQIYMSFTSCLRLTDCKIYDGLGNYGVNMSASVDAIFTDCEFVNNAGTHIVMSSSFPYLLRCIFDGGATPSTRALLVRDGCILDECEFGVNSQHSSASIYHLPMAGNIYARNCKFSDATDVQQGTTYADQACGVFCEDYNQVYGAHKSYVPWGTITRDTTIVRSSGADSSAKMEDVGVAVGGSNVFKLGNNPLLEAFRVWCEADVPTTLSVWIRATDAWSTYPTNSELYIDASYYDNAADTTRARSTPSTQVLSDGSTWVEFTTAFTPKRDGWAFLNVYLGVREAGKGINVDLKVESSA